jgi:HEAT repeat protein
LTPELTEPDAQTLTQFLLQRQPDDDKQSGQVLKNRLLNALGGSIETEASGEWMGELLAAIHQDHSQHPVLRDYALQHLAALFETLETREISHGMRIEIQHLLWTALRETDSSIAGTALLALARLSEGRAEEFNRTQINRTALRLASDSSAGELARISAFQVCGRLHVNEAMPVLLEVAQMGETVALRVAAISALGSVGDSSAISALQTVATSPVQRLAAPAQVALNRITESGRAR